MNKITKDNETMEAYCSKKSKKRDVIRVAVLFGLEMFFCGFTIGAATLIVKSKEQISAGYAVIPMLICFIISNILLINIKKIKDYFNRK